MRKRLMMDRAETADDMHAIRIDRDHSLPSSPLSLLLFSPFVLFVSSSFSLSLPFSFSSTFWLSSFVFLYLSLLFPSLSLSFKRATQHRRYIDVGIGSPWDRLSLFVSFDNNNLGRQTKFYILIIIIVVSGGRFCGRTLSLRRARALRRKETWELICGIYILFMKNSILVHGDIFLSQK